MSTILNPAHFMKKGDALPVLRRELLDTNGDPVDLSQATQVLFFMRREYAKKSDPNKIDGVAAVVEPDNVTARYEWDTGAGDTDTPGTYKGEFVAFFPGGDELTFPDQGWIPIRIADDMFD